MELYLLKSTAILAILFAFYKVILENTSVHTFKRIYLAGSVLAAFLIPLITFISYVEVSPIIPIYTDVTPQFNYTEVEQTLNYWLFMLWTIYGLGMLFFSIKFFRNLFGLIQQIRKNPKYKNTPFINVLLSETVIPHTFFNYIFLNKKQFENREIPQEVIFHEETHARQKHSFDIMFVEILQIVFWFNPLLHFIKKSIKLNHEFLADRAVLNAGTETSQYQKILLAFSSPDSYRDAATPSMAHSLNYSSIKKRFTLMKTRTSKRAVLWRILLLLPLLYVLIYGFSTKEVLKKEVYSELVQQKATDAEIKQYNKLAKKYNAIDIEDRIIPLEDLRILENIYKKMSISQRGKAQPFPECKQSKIDPKGEDNKKFSEANYYYKGERITFEKANELLDKNNNIGIYISKEENTVHLYQEPFDKNKIEIKNKPKVPSAENGNLYMAPEAPPAPIADPVEYVKELGKRGATFYIGPHKYSMDEAIEMVKKSTNDVTIDVSQYPIVHLGGC
jgi:beta-lactamase regulating signal transducer with metallopeptidase domain